MLMTQCFWPKHPPRLNSLEWAAQTKQSSYALIKEATSLKLVEKFTYLGSSVSSTKNDINMRLAKAWIAIYILSIIWKSNVSDQIKRSLSQAAVVSILLYGCTIWTCLSVWRESLTATAQECCELY